MKLPKATKLPSGKWNVSVQIGGQRVSVTDENKSSAQKKAALLKAQYQNGISGTIPTSLTLEQAMDAYIKARSKVLSPATIRGYDIIKRNRFQGIMHARIKDVKNWQSVVNQEVGKCSAKTLKNAWGFVKSVLKENFVDPGSVRLPMIASDERSFLDPDQIRTFVNAIEGDKYEVAYLLCLHGLRRSEMLALEKKDVTSQIRVCKAKVPSKDHKYVVKQTTKNTSSRRTVPVFFPRLTALVLQSPDGVLVPWCPDGMVRHLKKICRENSLPEIGFHGLRHSFASLCYHLNISELQAMEFGGWADLTVMRKIYTHVADIDRKKAAATLKDFFRDSEVKPLKRAG